MPLPDLCVAGWVLGVVLVQLMRAVSQVNVSRMVFRGAVPVCGRLVTEGKVSAYAMSWQGF